MLLKGVPKLFTQLFTVHGFRYNTYVPLVYCLLPGKTTALYEAAFRHIMTEIVDLGLTFKPTTFFADFEQAIYTAARIIWPSVSTQGCRFHLGQSWWWTIQKCSLTEDYKEKESEIGNFLKLFFGLPFLHPDDVEETLLISEDYSKPTSAWCPLGDANRLTAGVRNSDM